MDYLLEDAFDDFAVVAADGPLPVGEPYLFVSTETGELREEPSAEAQDKVAAMVVVPPASSG